MGAKEAGTMNANRSYDGYDHASRSLKWLEVAAAWVLVLIAILALTATGPTPLMVESTRAEPAQVQDTKPTTHATILSSR